MSARQVNAPRPLPAGFKTVGSILALTHLLAIGLLALAAPSGPWQSPYGYLPADGPRFAEIVTVNVTLPYYLQPLRMTHNYHFNSNRPAPFAAYFEVRLKNEQADWTKTLKFPDDKANFWVRHRQTILAQGLALDQTVPPRGTEVIPAPGQDVPKIEIWDRGEDGMLRLKLMEEHLLPRDRPVDRPSEWSKTLAQSFMRHLCRTYGASSAELIRHSREVVAPTDLIMPRPDAFFTELKSHFGEYRREK